MENQENDAVINELAEAVTREMEFYRELKRRRMVMAVWKPKTELNPQQEIAYQQSNCNPLLKEMAKTVLEEVQFNRNERRMAYRVAIIALIILVVLGVSIPLIIVTAVKSSKKHK